MLQKNKILWVKTFYNQNQFLKKISGKSMHMRHHFWNVFVRLMCMHNKLLLNVRIKKNNSINILFSTLK